MIFKIFFIVVVLLYVLYRYSSRNYKYWQKRNVPFIQPTPIFGNFFKTFTFKQTVGETLLGLCNTLDTPYFGVYASDKPILIVKDPEIIKHILVKDFNYFSDRYILSHEKSDPMASYMLFFAKNPEWKYIRTKMTSVFSSGKMKKMFYLIRDMGTDMTLHLNHQIIENVVEVKEICGKFSTNVISSCALGLDAQSFQHHDAAIRKHARLMFAPNFNNGFKQGSYFLAQGLVKTFKFPFIDRKVASFFREVFWKTIDERERSGEIRHDVIDVIIKDFKNQPYFNSTFKFEGDKLLAQATQFFSAGFETVSATMSFALYELSLHPEIQNRLRSEINHKIAKYECLTYEAMQSINYLDMVVNETLRKYPILSFLDRTCIKDYKVPNSDLVISKGIPVFVSLLNLHNDPKHYPNPNEFYPERFAKSNKHNITPFTYLPFGIGPRGCLGGRFATVATKVGLIEIISNFEVDSCSITPKSITFSPTAIFLTSAVGIPLRLKKIKVNN